VRAAETSVSTVPLETGKAERLESVERVRYMFGRQGQGGTAGRVVLRNTALASGSKGVSRDGSMLSS
jgi:hypothetical protein